MNSWGTELRGSKIIVRTYLLAPLGMSRFQVLLVPSTKLSSWGFRQANMWSELPQLFSCQAFLVLQFSGIMAVEDFPILIEEELANNYKKMGVAHL